MTTAPASLTPNYKHDGYHHARNAIPTQMLDQLEDTIAGYARTTAKRLGIHHHHDDYATVMRQIEAHNHTAFRDVLTNPGASAAALNVAAHIAQHVQTATGIHVDELYPSTVGVFWNDRHTPRLQYDWHQERSYYPDRTSIHCWFPLYRNITTSDGPMIVAAGSHHNWIPYETERDNDGLTQHRIPSDEVNDFPHVACTAQHGDVIVFHQLLAHRTSDNTSGHPRISGIVRYFTPTRDPDFRPVLQRLA